MKQCPVIQIIQQKDEVGFYHAWTKNLQQNPQWSTAKTANSPFEHKKTILSKNPPQIPSFSSKKTHNHQHQKKTKQKESAFSSEVCRRRTTEFGVTSGLLRPREQEEPGNRGEEEDAAADDDDNDSGEGEKAEEEVAAGKTNEAIL